VETGAQAPGGAAGAQAAGSAQAAEAAEGEAGSATETVPGAAGASVEMGRLGTTQGAGVRPGGRLPFELSPKNFVMQPSDSLLPRQRFRHNPYSPSAPSKRPG
jgi:hypothetical protein